MSRYPQFLQVFLPDVFKRLAIGLSAKTTVVTPNRRLALALKNQFDHFQVTQKLSAWESADILPFSAFIERVYEGALYSASQTRFPALLTATQVRALWESIIADSGVGKVLLAIPQTAKFAHEAWQLAHAWQLFPRLKDLPQDEESQVFQEWAQCFQRITKQAQQIDDALLCDFIIERYDNLQIKKPECVICYGFDTFTPQQIAFLEKLMSTGCEVLSAHPSARCQPHNVHLQRVVCVDNQDEIQRAATWARARIEANHAARIGVVVPSLAKYRDAVQRIFGSVMEPNAASALPGAIRRTVPFNISIGVALTSYPLINAVFQALELAGATIEFERASLLLRSPFLGGGEAEMDSRALLDAQIRKRAEPIITLKRLLTLVKRAKGEISCSQLMQHLSALAEFRQMHLHGSKKPSDWAKEFSALLQVIGFPGERTLDSTEHQTLKKWHEVVADFAALDHVITRLSYGEAISRLRRVATETLFQPETPDVPIQILGVLEAAGMEFDHLWVMGLSEEVWPLHSRPNPFLPAGLQRAAKLPMGSNEESLAFSQRLTNGWLSCANEVVCSHPTWSGDHKLKPSSLIKHIAETALDLPVYTSHRDLIQHVSSLECYTDYEAPVLSECEVRQDGVRGGAALIKDYAACPFRALARHRLNAQSLSVPHMGLNAMERGILVHDVLAQIWRHLKTKAALDHGSAGELDRLLKSVAGGAVAYIRQDRPGIFSGRFAEIEQRRLINLAREWLEAEKKRGYFTIAATEDKRSIRVGGLTLTTRLDRIDELADGQRIIIDYKTQKPSINAMLGDRPEEPQLPLYLVCAEPDAVAVVFALVKTKGMGFVGIARDEDLLPGIKAFAESPQRKQYESWTALIDSWRHSLETLAKGFSGGNASVDPKNYPATCRYCDVQPFCRIYEKIGAGFAARDDES